MKSFSSFNSNESINEESRTESGALFKSLVDKAHASSESGNHTQAKRHLANAQTARYGILAKHMAKHQASFDKYKELKHSYTNSDEPVREETELDEAHKINDKVEIIKGSSKGITGHIGEIRHGAFKGAPKEYTVYHGEHGATRVSKEHIRKLKEDVNEDYHVVANNSYYGDKQEPVKLSSHKSKDEADAALAKHKAASKTEGGNRSRWHKVVDSAGLKKHMDEDISIDEENLDELSNKLLNRYSKKAEKEAGKNFMAADRAQDRGNYDKAQAHMDKADKRASGVYRAQSKIKEESESVEESRGHKILATKLADMDRMKNVQIPTPQERKAELEKQQQGKKEMKEAIDTVKKDASGKVIAWSHEGDWEKQSTKNKQGQGKAANLAGKALKKTKELAKEEVEEDINESAWGKDKMTSLRQAHDRHMEKALAANKAGDDEATKVHQRKMQMIQGKMQKLKQNEEVELGEECEILLGEAAYTDVAAVRAKYKENESDNRHTENAELLAKHFGSKSDQNKVAKAKAYRDRNGGYSGDAEGRMHSNLAHEVHSKLYHHIKEEAEELDELDKKTLGSYISKSHDQLMKHTGSVNMKFGRGDKDAVAYSLDKTALRKTANRTKGMDTAISKLTKEEVEEYMQTEAFDQLDEISKDTLRSYVHKAATDIGFRGLDAGRQAGNPEDKDARSKNFKSMAKRVTGIDKAAAKLTKEDTEPMLTYSEFMAQLAEGKADDLRDKLAADRERRLNNYDYSKEKDHKSSNVQKVKGHSYGAGEDNEEGEDDVKTAKPEAPKRGRGRPAGSKSGARV